MSEFKPGDRIEVSNNGSDWTTRTYRGMFEGWVMVEAVGPPIAFKFVRPIVPQYRTPVMPGDYGKECEFWSVNEGCTMTGTLCGVITNAVSPFVDNKSRLWRSARIKME